jgi:hypothetical protein
MAMWAKVRGDEPRFREITARYDGFSDTYIFDYQGQDFLTLDCNHWDESSEDEAWLLVNEALIKVESIAQQPDTYGDW